MATASVTAVTAARAADSIVPQPSSACAAADSSRRSTQVLHGSSCLPHGYDERERHGWTVCDHGNGLIAYGCPHAHPKMACMSITRDEVAHLARLSRIALSDAELDHLAPQLDQIITAVAQVQEVAADGIPPTSHATGLTNVFRDDEPVPCLTPEEALDQAPAVEQQRFRVPRILAED